MKGSKAWLWLVIAAMVWAGTGISWKQFSVLGFSFILIFLVSRIFKFLTVWFISYYRVKRHQPVKSISELLLIFLNAIFSVGTPLFFFLALQHTTVSNAYFLQYTMPAWVLVFAVLFLGEKIDAKKMLGFLLTIVGIFLIASPQSLMQNILQGQQLGLLFGMLSAFSHCGDIITSRELKDYSYHTVSFYSNLLQILVAAAVTPLLFPFSLEGASAENFVAFAVIGLGLGIASDFYYKAMQLTEASTAAILSFSELIFAAILAFVFFKEAPAPNELVGYLLVLFAGIMIVLRTSDIERFEHLLRFTTGSKA